MLPVTEWIKPFVIDWLMEGISSDKIKTILHKHTPLNSGNKWLKEQTNPPAMV